MCLSGRKINLSSWFYVLDKKEDSFFKCCEILLGRPNLSTTRAKIDVHDRNLTLEFNGEIIKFNVYDAMEYPSDVSCVFGLEAFDPLLEYNHD